MANHKLPRRFALLVGVDFYYQGDFRRSKDGHPLRLQNLQGCVNDVNTVGEFLRRDFGLDRPVVLTSSTAGPAGQGSVGPLESPADQPTYYNIKRAFEAIGSQAEEGDLFFFHFSGHGARLEPVTGSPAGRSEDPSLLTVDFCCGKPAVSGWQLNEWLRKLNRKKVHVVVTLDSCHSGGFWRVGALARTPEKWPTVPSLPTDELAAEEIITSPRYRDFRLHSSWSINPEGFTLMAACESHELAAEDVLNGEPGGVFTQDLGLYLRSSMSRSLPVTYRVLRDHLAQQLTGQTPVVHGRDRLRFFGSTEPVFNTPMIARIEGDMVHLPVGEAHGVHLTSEFTVDSPSSGLAFSMTEVDDFESKGVVVPELRQALAKCQNRVRPLWWSFGERLLHVSVDPSIGPMYRDLVHSGLEDRVSSSFEVVELGRNTSRPTMPTLRVERRDEGCVTISGPEFLVGYAGPVRNLRLRGDTVGDLAANTAIALSHLGRFRQIMDIGERASPSPRPFDVNILPDGAAYKSPFPDNQRFRFTLRNKGDDDLFVAVLDLGPGLDAKQVFPASDLPEKVARNQTRKFPFRLQIADELKQSGTSDEDVVHREIIRTVVTKDKPISWKTLELPHIWQASQVGLGHSPRYMVVESESEWWVQDIELLIVSKM
ncbi:caspase domain-containing protein [Colletotrichum cereale]|nr:caspase domain-containing protein [Colletotrichum cereale]